MQQLLNAADVVILGHFVGKNAMAAVGNNTALIGLIVNLFMGLSLGANVVIAKNIGAEKFDKVHSAVQTSFLMSLVVGIFLCIVAELMRGPIFEMLSVPESVYYMAEKYFVIYALGLPAIGIYNFEAAIFRSRGDTQTPLIALTVASVLNIFLNLLFVIKFNYEIEGVAFATVISNFVSAIILFYSLRKGEGIIKLDLTNIKIDWECVKEVTRIGLPAGIQGMVFSFSNLIIQFAINQLGPNAMAASAAAFIVEINVYCLTAGFGQAATTFISQNYGAGDLPRCKKITKNALWLNIGIMAILSATILYFADSIIKAFSTDPKVIELGVTRIHYIIAPEIINVIMEVLAGVLRGYGISLAPAIITLIFVCGVRISWVYTIFKETPTYATLMATYGISWFLTAVALIIAYKFYMKHLKIIKV